MRRTLTVLLVLLVMCAVGMPAEAKHGRKPKRMKQPAPPGSRRAKGDEAVQERREREHREEWIRFMLGDEQGRIPPDGLARALEQRNALVRGGGRPGQLAPQRAGTPASPAGWTSLNGYEHSVGRVNDLLIHPTSTNTMWAATDGGGIWKTTDSGTTWQASNDFLSSLSISSLAMRPGDPSTIYAATGPQGSHTGLPGVGIYKSIDGGTNWSLLAATSPATNVDFTLVFQLAIHPTDSNTVLAATLGGAYITVNGGGIWTKITTTRANSVAIHPANANLRAIGMHDGTVKVATDGSTYNTYTIAASTASYTRIAFAPSNQSILYALSLDNSFNTTLQRSATGGTSWSPITPPSNFFAGTLFYTGGLWVDPANANHLAVSELALAITNDASVPSPTWTKSNFGWADSHGIVGDPGYNGTSNKKGYFFDDGGLYRWTDIDTMFTTPPAYLSVNGIVVTEVNTAAGRGGNVIFGAQDVASRYYRTTMSDPTQRWRFATLGGHDGSTTAADSTNPLILYGSTQALGIHRSTDGGVTNGFICQGITDISCGGYTGNSMFVAPFVLDPNNQSRMLAGAASLWRSNNVAAGSPPTWTAIHSGVGSVVTAIAVAPTDSNVIWVAYNNGNVYKTANGTDATPTWTPVANVPVGNKLRIFIDRTNAQRVYIGMAGFFANRLVTTPDGGGSWANVSGLPSASVFAIQQHPTVASWLYVGTAVGLFASEDSGATWSATNEGPASVQVRDLNWYSDSPAVLLVSTYGRGVWKATLSALAAPASLLATATSTTSVNVNWNTVVGATGYEVLRSTDGTSFTTAGTPAAPPFPDSGRTANTSYLYKVRATGTGGPSPDSNLDAATTTIFTDDPFTTGSTVIKAAHLTEIRTAVNAMRTLAGIGTFSFADPSPSGVGVKVVHITELRTALNDARAALLLSSLSFTNALTSGVTPVRAVDFTEVRNGVK